MSEDTNQNNSDNSLVPKIEGLVRPGMPNRLVRFTEDKLKNLQEHLNKFYSEKTIREKEERAIKAIEVLKEFPTERSYIDFYLEPLRVKESQRISDEIAASKKRLKNHIDRLVAKYAIEQQAVDQINVRNRSEKFSIDKETKKLVVVDKDGAEISINKEFY